MKKISLTILMLLLVVVVANSQTIELKEEINLDKLNKTIEVYELDLIKTEAKRKELGFQYKDNSPQIQEFDSKINFLKKELSELYFKQKKIENNKSADNLPNDDTELLKMIVIQNKRIIELLEKLNRQNSKN